MQRIDDITDTSDLATSLSYRTNDELRWLARRFTSKPPNNKQGLVSLLVSMTVPPGLGQTLDLAGEDGRAVLAHAAHGNGLLRTACAAVPRFILGSWEKEWFRRTAQDPPSVVLLFFPDERCMPPPLRACLSRLLPGPLQRVLKPLPGGPPGERLAGDAQTDLGVVLASARAHQLPVTKSGISMTALRRLAASMSSQSQQGPYDLLRLRCLTSFLIAAGWLERTATGVTATHREPDLKDLHTLFTTYLAWTHDELHDLTELRGTHDEFEPLSDPVHRRTALMDVLRSCPVGTWFDVEDLAAYAAATAPVDPILDHHCDISIGRDCGGSMHLLEDAGLTAVCHAWIRMVLGCYLAPLGVVEISLDAPPALPPMELLYDDDLPEVISQADRVAAIQLTPLGAWLLGSGPKPEVSAKQPGSWRIQADGSIIALGERIPPADRILLDQIAERHDERSWRLERPRLIAAIAGDTTAEAVRTHLTTLAGGTLPETVDRLLTDAVRRASSIHLEGPLIMLRVDDPIAREQLLLDRSTRAACRDCGGNLVGVLPEALTKVRRAARTLGWHIPDDHAR